MKVPGIPYVQGRNDYTDHDNMKYGIAIHNTANDATDDGEASYATRRTDGVSSHFYVDKDSVTQSIDTDDRVGHAGSNIGNNNAIAVEITGVNAKTRSWWLENVAWDKLGEVLAYVITHDPDFEGFEVRRASVAEMKSNPRVKAFYSHDDMRRAWGGTTHTDPGPDFPWDRLFQSVNSALGASGGDDDMPTVQELLNTRIDSPALGSRTFADWLKGGVAATNETKALAAKVELLTKLVMEQDADTDAIRAKLEEIDRDAAERAAALQAEVNQVAKEVVIAIGAEEDAAAIAKILRATLGDKASAVGAILAAG